MKYLIALLLTVTVAFGAGPTNLPVVGTLGVAIDTNINLVGTSTNLFAQNSNKLNQSVSTAITNNLRSELLTLLMAKVNGTSGKATNLTAQGTTAILGAQGTNGLSISISGSTITAADYYAVANIWSYDSLTAVWDFFQKVRFESGFTNVGSSTTIGTAGANAVTVSNALTLNGTLLYPTTTATTNLDWSVLSREITINSNTTFTLSNTNLSTEFRLTLNNTATTNIVVTLPAGVISLALQTNAQITVSALTTNEWIFRRDNANLIWLTVNGPSTAASASGSAGLTFEDFKIGNNIIWDDFQESSGSGSATWGPFHFIRNNGGTGAIGDAAGTTNAPGILRISTGTTAASWAAFYNYSSAGTAPYLIRGNWTNRVRFRFSALQNAGTATFRLYLGYGNSTSTAEPTEGGYVRYDTNDTHFVYITTTGGGTLKTTNATTLTPVASTWYEYVSAFNITGNSTNVVFWIDGANSVTYTASIRSRPAQLLD